MVLGGKTLDLKKVTIPTYELASREDHIAPARSVFTGPSISAVRCASSWPAPAISPASSTRPESRNISIWTDGPPEGDFESWIARAKETPGSWWPDWIEWLAAQAPEKSAGAQAGRGQAQGHRRRAGGE